MLRFTPSRMTSTTSHQKAKYSLAVTFALEGLGLASAAPARSRSCKPNPVGERFQPDQYPKRTNIKGPPPAGDISSRGHLVSSFLLSGSSLPLEDEVRAILPRNARFAGFNMLLLAPSQNSTSGSPTFDACFVSNGGNEGAIHGRPLSETERRCGGISNGIDSQGPMEWPKVKMGKSLLEGLLHRDLQEPDLVQGLFEILAWVNLHRIFC